MTRRRTLQDEKPEEVTAYDNGYEQAIADAMAYADDKTLGYHFEKETFPMIKDCKRMLDDSRKAEARVRETDTKRGEWARRIETISDMFHDWEISLGSPNDLQRFKEKHSYLDWDSNCEPERFLSSSLRALGEEMRRG